MFGRNPRESENEEQFNFPGESGNQEQFNFPNVNLQSDRPGEIYQGDSQDTVLQSESEKSELVGNVEKISRIISPYFIVLIGLGLYDSNFLLGLILIVTGILYLFKVSTRDIAHAWEWLRDTLGIGKD